MNNNPLITFLCILASPILAILLLLAGLQIIIAFLSVYMRLRIWYAIIFTAFAILPLGKAIHMIWLFFKPTKPQVKISTKLILAK